MSVEQKKDFSLHSFLEDWYSIIENIGHWMEENSHSLVYCLLGCAFTLILFFVTELFFNRILVPRLRKKFTITANILAGVSHSLATVLLISGLAFCNSQVDFPGKLDLYLDKVFYALLVIVIVRFLMKGIHGVNDILLNKFKKHDPATFSSNKLLLDLSRSLLKLSIWCLAVFFVLQNIFQWKITAVLASAGVLGLGIAFAAQNTIANLFGAFSILGSNLFVVGDWIKVAGTEGVVEQIGFRSIRIRAFEGRLIDLPNRIVADSQVENYSNRQFWRENFCFSLTYQTSADQIRQALDIIQEIGDDMTEWMDAGRPPFFTFQQFNQSSLDIDGFVWFKASSWWQMRESRARFNTEVLKRFTAAGLDFAYPTTTVFLENSR
jgi:MscS family membrane protein